MLLALQGATGVVLADEACAPKAFRREEDCGGLREVEGSLSDSGSVWLTLGAEYRWQEIP
jgi:hypothetical protein